ncbi:MAG TPA: alginate lyase family protein [bacterium]|nr:alginate lyase family protein [bacterium]HPG82047.1 alginate lyase family protein [bacterium]HPM59576.1 alginate lyase family protein [bacterium]
MSLAEYKSYWHRLRAMSPAEAAARLRGNLAGRWSRRLDQRPAPPLAALLAHPPLAPEALLASARARRLLSFELELPPRPGVWFAARWPEAHAALLDSAARAAGRRFTLFAAELSFTGPIDWHYDPVAQRSMPLSHWTAIPYWRPGYCPGVKEIWELNRCQHFVTLGQVWRLAGEEEYARALLEQWQGWLDGNPAGRGINWTSMLELGLRLISWSWALALVKNSPLLSAEFYARLLVSVHQQAAHISGHLSRGSSANNHLLGEALGLVYAGTCFPELKGAAAWRKQGFHLFWSELVRQVHPDGVIKEQSTGYMRYLYDYGTLAITAAAAAGEGVPPAVLQRMAGMAEFTAALIDEAGRLPQIGDGDDGQALLLDPAAGHAAPSPWRDLLGSAALQFGRADFKALSAGFSPTLFWLHGAAAEGAFARIPTPAGAPPSLRLFPEGGYAVLRSEAESGRQIGLLDAGPLGLDAMAAHGHADALSFWLTAGGEPLLIDSGTYQYRGEESWRRYFRSTAAHNTVRVAGRDQSQILGPFQWGRRAQARLLASGAAEASLAIAGEHDGYRSLGVIHRRRVRVEEGLWVVEDELLGRGRAAVELFWHLAPCRWTMPAPDRLEAVFGGCQVSIRLSGPASLRLQVVEGALEPIQGWFSPHFAVKKANPVLCINTDEALPVHIKSEIRIGPACERSIPAGDERL